MLRKLRTSQYEVPGTTYFMQMSTSTSPGATIVLVTDKILDPDIFFPASR